VPRDWVQVDTPADDVRHLPGKFQRSIVEAPSPSNALNNILNVPYD
jgi:hypothetical protein